MRARASAANEWSRLLRAPCSHQISRSECSSARAWSMARTGVAPIPALIRSTGARVWSRMKVPRGAGVLALDGDPVIAGGGRSGEGVVAQQRALVLVGPDAHREVPTWASGW